MYKKVRAYSKIRFIEWRKALTVYIDKLLSYVLYIFDIVRLLLRKKVYSCTVKDVSNNNKILYLL